MAKKWLYDTVPNYSLLGCLVLEKYLSESNKQSIDERTNFIYHNGVVNQAMDLVFLLKHYDFVTRLEIAPNPQVLKDFLLTSASEKKATLPDPFEFLTQPRPEDDTKKREYDKTNEALKEHYQRYQLLYWLVVANNENYKNHIAPFLDENNKNVETAKKAVAAFKSMLQAYIQAYGERLNTAANSLSWDSIDYQLKRVAEHRHYYDITYDLKGIENRFNPKMEEASKVLLASAAMTIVLMLHFGYMVDYGVWSGLFFIGILGAASYPYLSIAHTHRSIRDKAEQKHDDFQGKGAVDHQHEIAVIAFFSAFTILAFNMKSLIAIDAFSISLATITLLGLAAATAYDYISHQEKNEQKRTLSNEKFIATLVDKISDDKIPQDKSDRYFHHARAMFLNAGEDATKKSLLYRRGAYELAYQASNKNEPDAFHDDLIKQDKFYQGNAFVNEAIDFVAAAMVLTTESAHDKWVKTMMEASDSSDNSNTKTVKDYVSLEAYIAWVNENARRYLINKEDKLRPLTNVEIALLTNQKPTLEQCKQLDLLREEYPQYHLLKACASLNLLAPNAKSIQEYRSVVEKRIVDALGRQLTVHTGTPFTGTTLESMHKALREAQSQFGFWSLAAIPSQCKSLDYKSALTLAALGLTMAIGMVTSLVYSDIVGSTFRVGWMGYALTCAGMGFLASMACEGEQHKKMTVKQYHKDLEQTFIAAPSRVKPSL